jgi:predicted nucleic acid-binding protein
MLVDANLLLFAVDQASPFHEAADGWLTGVLNGARRVALPWPVLSAFVRISTHPRAAEHPCRRRPHGAMSSAGSGVTRCGFPAPRSGTPRSSVG